MSILARHCQTRRFTEEQWRSIPVWAPRVVSGIYRMLDEEGRAIVRKVTTDEWFRPIIRVRARTVRSIPINRINRGMYRGLVAGDWMTA